MLLRLHDEDREKYGGPEELDFAAVPAWLDDLGYDDLVAVEDQVVAAVAAPTPPRPGEPPPTLMWVMERLLWQRREATLIRMIRVRAWLALRAAGVDLALADFRPAHLAFGLRVVKPTSDAVPPADESDSSPTSSPESDETTTTSTSESFTDASTPGPDASTA